MNKPTQFETKMAQNSIFFGAVHINEAYVREGSTPRVFVAPHLPTFVLPDGFQAGHWRTLEVSVWSQLSEFIFNTE